MLGVVTMGSSFVSKGGDTMDSWYSGARVLDPVHVKSVWSWLHEWNGHHIPSIVGVSDGKSVFGTLLRQR